MRWRARAVALVWAFSLTHWPATVGADVVHEQVITAALDRPVSMAVAPDGRVFICEQAGRVRVVRAGRLLSRPVAVVPTHAQFEEGLLAVACDPDFNRTHHLYLLFTVADPARHERLLRVTVSGDTTVAGSDSVLFDLDPHTDVTHVGGALRFGEDGMLYVGTGENGIAERAQDLRSTHGKVLRLRRDGSIPEDNPFGALTTGRHRAIFARGFRNAFSMDVQPGTGRIFVNDVGADSTEEVNDLVAGGNYGWPMREGARPAAGLLPPIRDYPHRDGCAITAGLFCALHNRHLPSDWSGDYLYSDFCTGTIRAFDPARPGRAQMLFETRVPGPVDLRLARDGSLLYLARGQTDVTGNAPAPTGALVRVTRAQGRTAPRPAPHKTR